MNNTSEDRGFKELPLGEIVENTTAAQIPASKLYLGKFVSLQPVDPEKDGVELYHNSNLSLTKLNQPLLRSRSRGDE